MSEPKTEEPRTDYCPHGVAPPRYCDVCPSKTELLLTEIRDMLKEQYVCGHGIRGFCPFCLKSETPG